MGRVQRLGQPEWDGDLDGDHTGTHANSATAYSATAYSATAYAATANSATANSATAYPQAATEAAQTTQTTQTTQTWPSAWSCSCARREEETERRAERKGQSGEGALQDQARTARIKPTQIAVGLSREEAGTT